MSQTLVQRIEALRMTSGHLPDAYLDNSQAAGLHWYFSTLGVFALAQDGAHDAQVRAYLDKYLANATLPGGAIDDVADLTQPNIVWRVSDSDDSYAATILSLACWYANRPGGQKWFISKLPQLRFIATANLIDTISPTLDVTFTYNSLPGRFGQRGGDRAGYQIVCQLMDGCEAYRGLLDFSNQLTKINDPEASKYSAAAKRIASGLARMYDPAAKGFRYSSLQLSIDPTKVKFYPDRVIQVAPQVYGVNFGANTQALYDSAWAYLNAGGDAWWLGQINDGSNDGSPFMILAYAASLRGEWDKSSAHVSYFLANLDSAPRPIFSNIHELGYALRASRSTPRKFGNR